MGFRHSFPVLDYLVPDNALGQDLNRAADLSRCRVDPNNPGGEPSKVSLPLIRR